ncbi:hypothetical protein CC1G_00451 [Coprinopsis cinerea okayama7|uniref:Uncharacterized protein n=1 Tax=Coprinopsis cinerea (strain Okayama-7 / 130 / ATCC MYA-4618 / FGSC 9003) TaxID=240176 RepID=A8NXZ7_COPC7|nr:hypothetical protein CC1G_00451 [Coprinopsis cinerea okayama7\|eukprot:XP_001837315.1 hypothetical protein CC1G_00451 [Coprinopsis cinerea okayama7\
MSAPTSPIIAKSVQKEITAEAKREQKAFQHMVKDLEHLEKKDNKAHKHVDKMAKALNKNEQKEQKTMQKMHKATEIHEDTKLKTTHLHRELQASKQEEDKIRSRLKEKKLEVENAMLEKESNEQARLRRLDEAKRQPEPTTSDNAPVNVVQQPTEPRPTQLQ